MNQAIKRDQDYLHFLESLDSVNHAIQGTNDIEQMMQNVLDTILSIFDCDRAFLLYPCDPEATTWRGPMERTRPEYPGVLKLGLEIPMDEGVAETFRFLLASDKPVKFGPGTPNPLPTAASERFGFKSFMSMAFHPKIGKPWQFGLHQCSCVRNWTTEEERLFEEIAHRLADALSSLLAHQNLLASEERYRLVFENSPVSIWEEDFSLVKAIFDDLKNQGVTDIEDYFDRHPETLQHCAELAKIVDVNKAALALHGAADKKDLLTGLSNTFLAESLVTFRRELACLWNGITDMSVDTIVKTFAGERRNVSVYFSVCPGQEKTLSRVFVSLIDITERKRAEEALLESERKVQRKLNAILSPETGIGALELSDIIDVDQIQKLTNEFYRLAKISVGIIDLKGRVLVKTGWQDVCTRFYRANEESCRLCLESNVELSRNIPVGTFKQYKCKNNIWNIATPIMLGDQHVGNIVLGQFFFEDEDLDYEIFRGQARRFGFDETEYISALNRVPRFSQQTVDAALSFYTVLARMMGDLSYSNIKLAKALDDRKRAEQNAILLDFALNNVREAAFLIDESSRFCFVNEESCRILGYTREELLCRSVSDVDPYLPLELWSNHWAELKERRSLLFEGHHRAKDGLIFPVEISANFLEFENKTYNLALVRDITERKRAEKALRESEQTLKSLINSTPDIICFKDGKGRWLQANDSDLELFSLTNVDYHGKTDSELAEFTDPIYRSTFLNCESTDEKAWKSGGIVRGEETIPKPDGTHKVFDVIKVPIFEFDGSRKGLVVLGRDITKRKQAEEFLKKTAERLNEAQRIAHIGNWELDLTNNVLIWSDEIYRIFEIEPAKFAATYEAFLATVHPDDREAVQLAYSSSVETRKPYAIEHRLLFPDGRIKYVYERCETCYEDDKPILSIGTVQDVTERKRLEEQLRQSQKLEAVGQLAGGVAHDFNNMLVVITGYAEVVLGKMPSNDPLREHLVQIKLASERSAEITRQLLAFARKQDIEPQTLNLNQTIEGMIKLLRRLIGEDIDLVWLPCENIWPVRVDPSQIDQILTNLCVNAKDAIVDVGRITIETHNVDFDDISSGELHGVSPGEYVLLTVSDNGKGMSKSTMSKVFEPFFTTKEMGKGTGLGLATVYGIVKQNSGFINVYSEQGCGSAFKVYLPRHEDKNESILEKRPSDTLTHGSEIILLVEDDTLVLGLVKMMLENCGYQVLASSTPEEAIHIAKENSGEIALLLTDVVMPEMTGQTLAKELKSYFPKLKCLFMSGYTNNIIARHGVLDEGTNFIPKPFSIQSLTAKVRKILDVK